MQPTIDRAYYDLANAIVLQAVVDYRKALNGNSYNAQPSGKIVAKLEKFFHSDWFAILTTVDGDYLIDQIRKERPKKRRKRGKKSEGNPDTTNQ
jgi:hypothetical protein